MATSEEQLRDIQGLMLEAAEVQLATLRSGVGFWRDWVDISEKYAQRLEDGIDSARRDPSETASELVKIADDSGDLIRAFRDRAEAHSARMTHDLEELVERTHKRRQR